MADRGELLLDCRRWMQSALEALTLCPSAHTCPSLREGDELLKQLDDAIRGGLRSVNDRRFDSEPYDRRLHELEAALFVVGKAFSSLEALVRAAKAMEGRTDG